MSAWRENLGSLTGQVKDHRIYEKQDVDSVLLFCFHLEDLMSNCGAELRGWNVASLGWCYRLIVKATIDDTPLVAFISERTTSHCMRVFLRQMEEKRVKWSLDRFA